MNQRMSNQEIQKVSRWAASIAAQNPKIQQQLKIGSWNPFERQCKTQTHTYNLKRLTLPTSSALIRINSFLLWEPATSLPLVSMKLPNVTETHTSTQQNS